MPDASIICRTPALCRTTALYYAGRQHYAVAIWARAERGPGRPWARGGGGLSGHGARTGRSLDASGSGQCASGVGEDPVALHPLDTPHPTRKTVYPTRPYIDTHDLAVCMAVCARAHSHAAPALPTSSGDATIRARSRSRSPHRARAERAPDGFESGVLSSRPHLPLRGSGGPPALRHVHRQSAARTRRVPRRRARAR